VKQAYFGSFLLALALHALVFGAVMWRLPVDSVRAVGAPVVLIRSIGSSLLALQGSAGNAPEANSAALTVAKPSINKPALRSPIQPKARTQAQRAPQPPQPELSLPNNKQPPKPRTLQPPVALATGSDSNQSSTAVAAPTSSSASKALTTASSQVQPNATAGNKNAKPVEQGGESNPKPALGSICTHTVKPEMPTSEMVFDAWITVAYKIDDGKINRVDLIREKYSAPVDQRTRKAFLQAIEEAADKYVCRGSHSGILQEFSFHLTE
jgi:outer membrane biosynthesis protein TonB